MSATIHVKSAASVFVVASLMLASGFGTADAEEKKVRGWLSDESCARPRAKNGAYTNTNPECARKCVAKGEKIVLILPEEKRILAVTNQELAKSQVGNLVEISGTIDDKAESIEIKSLTFLEEGRASCAYPRKKT